MVKVPGRSVYDTNAQALIETSLWTNNDFSVLEGKSANTEEDYEINYTQSRLPSEQEYAPRARVQQCIGYLLAPEYRKFLTLHSNECSVVNFGNTSSTFINYWGVKERWPSDPSAKLEALWKFVHAAEVNGRHVKLKSYAPETLNVVVKSSHRPETETFEELRLIYDGLAGRALDDCFTNTPSIKDIIRRGENVTMAFVTFMAQNDLNDKVAPLCFSLYLNDSCNVWCQYQLLSGDPAFMPVF